ncbi:hypothetical protein [Lysobacter sp. CA199]|uniref:hypothetical protein n=1 Tax=Lysobacter sp. CA199 TaxID=3455608 RepID=UPI003F8D64D7
MDPISLEDLALLDVLQRIDQGHPPGRHSQALRERLVEAALAQTDDEGEHLSLTDAGVERCKSLRHRVAADAEAALVLKEREEAATQEPEAATD